MRNQPTAAWTPLPLSRLQRDQIPSEIFLRFKKELGEVNSHLCIVDAAMQRLAHDYARSPNKIEFLRLCTRCHGHRHLASDKLDFDFSIRLAYISQIALLLSRLEQLCRSIGKHPFINKNLKERMVGDFLRRAIWLVAASREGEKLPTPIEDSVTSRYLDPLDIGIFDFYRTMRNLELHPATPSSPKNDVNLDQHGNLAAAYSKIDQDRCKAEFNYTPTLSDLLSFRDVLLVSMSCQRIARSLCRSIVDPERDLLPELKRKFANQANKRRNNAARALLSQSFLLDSDEVEALVCDLAW